MLNVLRVISPHPSPWEGCDIPCFPRAAHQPWRLQPCQAPAGSGRRFEMPKPFLGFFLQTHEGDLPLPGVLPWLHWALLSSQPELGGAVTAWLVFGLCSFLSLIFREQGGDSPPSPRTWKAGLSPPLQPGWACCQRGARGCYQGWAGPGSPVTPQDTLIMGGPRLPCAAAIAQRAWDTCGTLCWTGDAGGAPR